MTQELRKRLSATGTKTLHIKFLSPWENDRRESSNPNLRDEFLNGEIVNSLQEAQVPAEGWRVYRKTWRPHSSLGYRPPRW